jgi:hypothetical protein
VSVRNPDVYFAEATRAVELGGVEITVHSPDGANVEKRYPFVWVARREGINAFVACPYSKVRPGGETNRLPYRHSHRNSEFLGEWKPSEYEEGALQQIVPVRELQGDASRLPGPLQRYILDWAVLGEFFAHVRLSRHGLSQGVLCRGLYETTFADAASDTQIHISEE